MKKKSIIIIIMSLLLNNGCNDATKNEDKTLDGLYGRDNIQKIEFDENNHLEQNVKNIINQFSTENDISQPDGFVFKHLKSENLEDLPIVWWLHGWGLGVNTIYDSTKDDFRLSDNENELFSRVNRFDSLKEMKAATEKIFNPEFAREHLYSVNERENPFNQRLFVEFDDGLYLNIIPTGGWNLLSVIGTRTIYESNTKAKVEIFYELPPLDFSNQINERHIIVYQVDLEKVNNSWRFLNFPNIGDNTAVKEFSVELTH